MRIRTANNRRRVIQMRPSKNKARAYLKEWAVRYWHDMGRQVDEAVADHGGSVMKWLARANLSD